MGDGRVNDWYRAVLGLHEHAELGADQDDDLDAARILAAYGEPVDPGQLEVCQQLRKLHLTVWYNLYAERLPALRPRAAELLAQWPAA